MSKPSTVVITKQRTIHTYAELWHASECVLDVGLNNPEGAMWQFLSCTVLTAFSFEAYLNHAGAVTFECWEELERLPPWAKLQLLLEELDVQFPEGIGARPLQTIARLLNFRNTMAHGRTSELQSKPLNRTTENYHQAYGEDLLTDWERLVRTSDFAVRAREDVRTVLTCLHEARRDEKEHLFTFGMALYGATLVVKP
ncbi:MULTISPECIES: hypothetical protein [unclassified Pseudomonas]|uniref:hypothetical protein n=1 Tax=unclassified Pseudomonas TaxID=196821 RepID=UPI00128AFA85|nr:MULTISPECIES: hypothetical protein [unclassified Pseudomonas]MPQ66542.1 hypothetical protein [Pseudomonas sp. MWU12-2323]